MRLIDADELTKDFNTFTESFVMTTDKCGNFVISCNAPTAYNVDKVVNELIIAREDYDGDSQCDIAYGLALAIEIVKRGGKNDE